MCATVARRCPGLSSTIHSFSTAFFVQQQLMCVCVCVCMCVCVCVSPPKESQMDVCEVQDRLRYNRVNKANALPDKKLCGGPTHEP